jgi:hypothetical protein
MLRAFAILFGLTLSLPAAAQLATAQPSWLLADEDDTDAPGFVFQPLSGGEFNLARPGSTMHGFRVTPEVGAFMGYRRGNWLFGSTLTQVDDAQNESTALDLGAAYGIDLTAKQRLSVEGGIRFDLSSDLHMPYSLAPNTVDNGLGLRMSWRYSFDSNRYISTSLGYEQSLGDAADGGAERNGAVFGTHFGYRY